jgi:hypothetical protein
MNEPLKEYSHKLRSLKTDLDRLKKKQHVFGWTRLALVVLTAVISYRLFYTTDYYGWIALITGLVAFIILISADTDNNRKIRNIHALVTINEEEIALLQHNFTNRFDGLKYLPGIHDYAADLDVFGKASLYQYLNRCYTEQGRKALADNFLYALPVDEIKLRHEAIKELSGEVEWRQQLQAFAMYSPLTDLMQTKIETWVHTEDDVFTSSFWKWFLPVYAVITISSAIAAIAGLYPFQIFAFLVLMYIIFSSILSKKPSLTYIQLNKISSQVEGLEQLVKWIENKKFKSSLLINLQNQLVVDGHKASFQIKELKNILGRFDLRLNVFVFIILNGFLLWDVWQMRALNSWKKKNKNGVAKWFYVIEQAEVLHSLASIHFNHPSWSFPAFKENYFFFEATNLGHPLLPAEQRVTSNFHMDGKGKIALVTGSNMAGKSTFLRSLGTNVILAQMGAPVCASSMQLSPVQLMTSMRIADNLAENTSTFYAELKKLQVIIEAVKKRSPVFILLDEILRGTNSFDRHIGSKALIKQLIKEETIAVIATHDVELSQVVHDNGRLQNYHFDVQVDEEDELYFDYKLKPGICTNLNASILMKKIGIELEEQQKNVKV